MSKPVAFLRQHYDLIPLMGAVGFASCLAVGATLRTALKNPDVSWNKKTNPEPWNKIRQDEQVKFMNPVGRDYKSNRFPEGRPSLSNETYKGI